MGDLKPQQKKSRVPGLGCTREQHGPALPTELPALPKKPHNPSLAPPANKTHPCCCLPLCWSVASQAATRQRTARLPLGCLL